MDDTALILFRVALMNVLLEIFVSSEYIIADLQPVLYGKDDIIIRCRPTNLQQDDSIYSIFLSKKINDNTNKIVEVTAETNHPPDYLKVIWYDQNMKSRANTNKSRLLPTLSAELVLIIPIEYASCKDGGMYHCDIVVSGEKHGSSTQYLNITVPEYTFEIQELQSNSSSLLQSYKYENQTLGADFRFLRCIAKFRSPGCIRWCIKMQPNHKFDIYDIKDLVTSQLIFNGCYYQGYSDLRYSITKEDTHTQLICKSALQECEGYDGKYKASINISSVEDINVTVAIANVSSSVVFMEQNLQIGCVARPIYAVDSFAIFPCLNKQLNQTEVLQISNISSEDSVYRNAQLIVYKKSLSSYIPLVELRCALDNKTNIIWHDKHLENRSNLEKLQTSTDLLQIIIPAEKVECSDAGLYRCEFLLNEKPYSIAEQSVNLISLVNYIRINVSSPIKKGRQPLEVGCITSYFSERDTINKIALSKKNDSVLKKMVTIELDIDTQESKWTWYDKGFFSRVSVYSGKVYPAHQAFMYVKILPSSVECYDAGIYICEVFASYDKTGYSNSEINITVFSSLAFPVYDNKCDNGWYEVGDDLLLSCLLTVGNPPRIPRWCRKLKSEKFFTDIHNKTNTFNGDLIRQGCQYERRSFLQYKITETDTNTQLVCVVTDSECNTIQPNNIFMIRKLPDDSKENLEIMNSSCYEENDMTQETGCEFWYFYTCGISIISVFSFVFTTYMVFHRYRSYRHEQTDRRCCRFSSDKNVDVATELSTMDSAVGNQNLSDSIRESVAPNDREATFDSGTLELFPSDDHLMRHTSNSRGVNDTPHALGPSSISCSNRHINVNVRGSRKDGRVVESETTERPIRSSAPTNETFTNKRYETANNYNTNSRNGIKQEDEIIRRVHGIRQPTNNIDRHAIQRHSCGEKHIRNHKRDDRRKSVNYSDRETNFNIHSEPVIGDITQDVNNSFSTDFLTRYRYFSRGATYGLGHTNISSTNRNINANVRGSSQDERIYEREKNQIPTRSSSYVPTNKTFTLNETAKHGNSIVTHGIKRDDKNTPHDIRQPIRNVDRHTIQRNSRDGRNRKREIVHTDEENTQTRLGLNFGGQENRNLATDDANDGNRRIDLNVQSNRRDDRKARESGNNKPIKNDRPDVILTNEAFTRRSNESRIVYATKPENRIPYTPCEICKADVAVNRVLIPCLHKMCYSCCLNTEKNNNNRCPFCRKNIEDLNYVCCNPIAS